MIKIGLPHMGVYGGIIRRIFNEHLRPYGVEIISAPLTTRRTINRGAQLSDENMCLPAKVLLGNLLELADLGIMHAVEWDNCGDCRQKLYPLIHQSILRQLGVKMNIIPLQPRGLILGLSRIAPYVPKKVWEKMFRELVREVWKHDLTVMEEFVRNPGDGPKMGVCGEVFTVLEPAANNGLIRSMKEQGACVHHGILLGEFLHFPLEPFGQKRVKWLIAMAKLGMWPEIWQWLRGDLRRPDVDPLLYHEAVKIAEEYFQGHEIGGEGNQSVIWMAYYALAGFDGVVHVGPFPCMPESAVVAFLEEISKRFGTPVNHYVFDQQFGEQNLITRAQAQVNLLRFKREGIAEVLKVRRPGLWLGVDVGSTSTKAVLLDGQALQIVDSEYQFTHRKPLEAIRLVLTTLLSRNLGVTISGMATTGSGRRLAQALLNAPLAIDEISCQVIGCLSSKEEVLSIIEIGGQDSKFISLDGSSVPTWFNMNSICSAGTGAFLTSAAREFGIPISELGSCARRAGCSVTITGRCGIFAEADIVSKQQAGYPPEAIVKGMCDALAANFLSNVARSRKLDPPVVITGGVALNEGVVDAFSKALGTEVLPHPYAKISGALGAAILAMMREACGGLDIASIKESTFDSTVFTCHDCANECEVSLIVRNEEIVAALGSRCGKYEGKVGMMVKEVKDEISEKIVVS